MKQASTFLTLLIITALTSYGQTFNLSDTTIYQGDVLTSRYNIYWDFAKAILKPESSLFLDSIAAFMSKNKGLVIEVGHHRDNRNPEQYTKMSQFLTHSRAESLVKYLISKGIEADRLVPKGYGAAKLLITNEEIDQLKTEKEKDAAHAWNRRTEFTVLRIDYRK